MYLKEIEASGFKSFADKLKITLDDNITCIVGPNGSGKSNVVDAVRWVLGEQSVKSLRGDGAMSDVIFSGSKSRNALNVASVTLTFDNGDNYLKLPYSEISIKRRVYRTGENEYFINGEKCRLKDINELFMDSGIGKESFNIISQGEVQKILSNSPYDRRVIFEEAAGVLKYKKRKEEAIRKLDRTHNNLERVNDIIEELSIQVEPLREQSKKAREYLENKKNLENIEVALISYEITLMNEEYQVAKNRLEELNNEILILSNANNDASLDSKKLEVMQFEKLLSEENKKLLEVTREEERVNGEKRILLERSNYNATDSRIHEKLTTLTEAKLKYETELSTLELEIKNINELVSELKNNLREKENNLTSLKNTREASLRELNYKEKEQIELTHKASVLKNYIESGSGYLASVKAVIKNPRLRGIHDTIGNLVETDEKYSKALEVALGGSKQFLIVENEEAAKDAINYLKENRLGRATFFPLSVIRGKNVDSESLSILEKDPGFVDVLINLVSYDPMYKSVMANQMGNVVIAKDIDDANRLSRRLQNRYKIVTLDGEVVHIGGSITGGTVSNTRSTITDKLELSKLEKLIESSNRVISELKEKVKNLEKEIYEKETELFTKKSEVFQTEEEEKLKFTLYNSKKLEYRNIELELSNLNSVVDSSLSKEEEKVMTLYYEIVKLKEEVLANIKKITKEIDKLKEEILEIEAKNKINNSNLSKCEKESRDLEISISKMDVKLDHYLTVLSEDYELTYEKASREYTLELELDEAREKVSFYKNSIKNLGMVNLAAIEEFERVNTRYEFLTSQKNDLLNAKDTLLEIISEMDDVMKTEFKDTFKKVEVEFKNVFKQLFNGGNASLKLTDPDDVLNTGVEIIASPPGKKLTTISLLSGGEKTLTAISLLFAILNVRTVPFCLFDEVEAALDEANVDNFGTYLDHYKSKTQFLLITHKKKTMEYANTLYGITMQESGVSKLVSVKFEDIEKDN